MGKKLLFLINPNSGKSEIKTRALDVIDLFVRSGFEISVHTTQRRMEIPEILKEQGEDCDLIVTSGGDGTLNETVTGLMALPQKPLLGYIPAGTVNDFATSLHIPKNILQAAHVIVSGQPFDCDIGALEDRYFTYIAAFGAFTDVSYQTPQQSKLLLGRAAYILEGIKRLPSIKDYHLIVRHDGKTVEDDFIFGMVTNSTSVGGFKIHEQLVKMNDGLLEVVLIRRPESAIEAPQLLNAVLRQEYSSESVYAFRTSELEITSEEEVPWTLDGEFGGMRHRAHIRNVPRAIRILRGSDSDSRPVEFPSYSFKV